jgi:hypothetical protein
MMTIEFTHGSAPGARLVARMTDPIRLAAAFIRGMAQGLYLQLAVDLRAARKRRRLRLQTLHLLDHCIYAELSQARRALDFTYRNNLDRR